MKIFFSFSSIINYFLFFIFKVLSINNQTVYLYERCLDEKVNNKWSSPKFLFTAVSEFQTIINFLVSIVKQKWIYIYVKAVFWLCIKIQHVLASILCINKLLFIEVSKIFTFLREALNKALSLITGEKYNIKLFYAICIVMTKLVILRVESCWVLILFASTRVQ